MSWTRDQVESEIMDLLRKLADDWDFAGNLTAQTYLLRDMGFESLDVVVLSTHVQEHFKRVLPFNALFTEIGQREVRDITVGEWVEFTYRNLSGAAGGDVGEA